MECIVYFIITFGSRVFIDFILFMRISNFLNLFNFSFNFL